MKKRRQIFKQLGWGIWAQLSARTNDAVTYSIRAMLLLKIEDLISHNQALCILKEIRQAVK